MLEIVPQQEKEDVATKSFLPQKLHETAQQYYECTINWNNVELHILKINKLKS